MHFSKISPVLLLQVGLTVAVSTFTSDTPTSTGVCRVCSADDCVRGFVSASDQARADCSSTLSQMTVVSTITLTAATVTNTESTTATATETDINTISETSTETDSVTTTIDETSTSTTVTRPTFTTDDPTSSDPPGPTLTERAVYRPGRRSDAAAATLGPTRYYKDKLIWLQNHDDLERRLIGTTPIIPTIIPVFPGYASACTDDAQFASACSCLGVTGASATTVYETAAQVTNTVTVVVSNTATVTTEESTTEIATATISDVSSTTTTTTVTATATSQCSVCYYCNTSADCMTGQECAPYSDDPDVGNVQLCSSSDPNNPFYFCDSVCNDTNDTPVPSQPDDGGAPAGKLRRKAVIHGGL